MYGQPQGGEQFGPALGQRLLRRLDQRADMVARLQRRCHQRGRAGRQAAAHTVEGGFEIMNEDGHGFEAEHGAGALDGMQRPERRIDQAAIIGPAAQIQQRLLKLLQQFRRFLAEDLGGLDGAAHPSTFLTMASSCACSKGLVIQPVAPACFASILRAASDSVVRKMIGTPL